MNFVTLLEIGYRIGLKYDQIQELHLDLTKLNILGKEFITLSLNEALTNMKHLKKYSVNLCPTPQATLSIMETNNLQLDQFGFLLERDNQSRTLASIQASQSISTVSSLAIKCQYQLDASILSHSLTDLCSSLKYLTNLDVNCNKAKMSPILIFSILRGLPMLKILVINNLQIDDLTSDEFIPNSPFVAYSERLESISIRYCWSRERPHVAPQLNRLIASVLQLCPNLQVFNIYAISGNSRGTVKLGFRHNLSLRQALVDIRGCQCYTFQHEAGKYWKNVGHQIMQTTIREW